MYHLNEALTALRANDLRKAYSHVWSATYQLALQDRSGKEYTFPPMELPDA